MSGLPAALARARRILSRRGAWIEAGEGGYVLRTGVDRRARVVQTLDERAFRALVDQPGLKTRAAGGWSARPDPAAAATPAPGRPGVIDGSRMVMRTDGGADVLKANLGLSSIAWLSRHRGPDGKPWLTPAQIAAAARLEQDAEIALSGPSMTMRWDALPRSGAGGDRSGLAPGDRALAAGRRVQAALAACGPARSLVDHVCLRASALQAAEQTLGLRRRSGKLMLKDGLDRLARHYRLA